MTLERGALNLEDWTVLFRSSVGFASRALRARSHGLTVCNNHRMDHSSYSRELDRLKRGLDGQVVSESEAVELLCKVADLVRQRTEALIERSGRFLGYDYSASGGGDGGLLNRS